MPKGIPKKLKPCAICGKLFLPKSPASKICETAHYAYCPICGNQMIWNTTSTPKPCSKECRKELTRRKNQKKYGCDHPMQNETVKTRYKESIQKIYGKDNPMRNNIISHRSGTSRRKSNTRYAHIQDSGRIQSFAEILKSRNIYYEMDHMIGTMLYDMYIPESHTVVELSHVPYAKYHHKDKTMNARNHGYNCVNIWDFDDYEKMIDIIAKPLVTVYAKDCRLFKIHKNVGDEFIEEYDIHGNPRGQLLYLGLVYQGQLVQIMTFSKPMYNKNHYVELKRFCTKSRYKIIGGASRLLKFAMQGFDIYDIITYNDDSKFSGNVFKKIGMRLDHTNQPQILWTKENRYISNNLLYLYGKYKSDMIDEGYIPIYDCGTSMYVI